MKIARNDSIGIGESLGMHVGRSTEKARGPEDPASFFAFAGYANIARQLGHAGEQYVMIHPADARARGIAEGEQVEVFNDRGRFQTEAQVSDEVRPSVIVSPLGYWASASPGGRSVNVVNTSRYADMGRAPTFSDTRVQVRRIEA